jgi:hypothetical protein
MSWRNETPEDGELAETLPLGWSRKKKIRINSNTVPLKKKEHIKKNTQKLAFGFNDLQIKFRVL